MDERTYAIATYIARVQLYLRVCGQQLCQPLHATRFENGVRLVVVARHIE
jgi:hypothetical protein